MGERLGVGQVVYRDQIYVGIAEPCSDNRSADPSKAVNTYFNSHFDLDSSVKVRILKP